MNRLLRQRSRNDKGAAAQDSPRCCRRDGGDVTDLATNLIELFPSRDHIRGGFAV